MRFKKGQSGNEDAKFTSTNQPTNPGRRPGIRNRSTIARELLAQVLDMQNYNTKNARTLEKLGFATTDEAEALLTAVQIVKGLAGDTQAYKAVADSAYGAPKQAVEHTGEDGGPILYDDLSTVPPDEIKRRIDAIKRGATQAA